VAYDSRVVFSWLGVTMYLSPEAILKMLDSCSRFLKSSSVVLTFANSRSEATEIEKRVESLGEPWISKFDEMEIIDLFRQAHFADFRVVPIEEIQEKYFAGRGDAMRAPRLPFLAVGIV
jgi:O-methyltransferase involved in polyketide biosynthesis